MSNYENRISKTKAALQTAEYIIIGGGAGLSEAAGLQYSGERFTINFAPFIEKYGFKDLYTSSFYPFDHPEERWAYWAKHISMNHYEQPATELYQRVYRLVENAQYFVLTTNVEYQFHKAGFSDDRIFMVQGDYGYFQCAKGCNHAIYSNEEQIKVMLAHTKDCRIPTSLVPRCPVCGGEMIPHMHQDSHFIRDEYWCNAYENYQSFLKKSKNKRIVFLEMGVGFLTPHIIRLPFEQLTSQNPNALLVRFNRDFPGGVKENKHRTIAFSEDMATVLKRLVPD